MTNAKHLVQDMTNLVILSQQAVLRLLGWMKNRYRMLCNVCSSCLLITDSQLLGLLELYEAQSVFDVLAVASFVNPQLHVQVLHARIAHVTVA